jgi:hypothetical protein
MSDADQNRLREMGDHLEKELAGAGMQMTGAAGQTTTATGAAPAIRKLDGGPVEAVSVAKDDDEPKEYGGEYYPVAKPHTHHDAPPEAKPKHGCVTYSAGDYCENDIQ